MDCDSRDRSAALELHLANVDSADGLPRMETVLRRLPFFDVREFNDHFSDIVVTWGPWAYGITNKLVLEISLPAFFLTWALRHYWSKRFKRYEALQGSGYGHYVLPHGQRPVGGHRAEFTSSRHS